MQYCKISNDGTPVSGLFTTQQVVKILQLPPTDMVSVEVLQQRGWAAVPPSKIPTPDISDPDYGMLVPVLGVPVYDQYQQLTRTYTFKKASQLVLDSATKSLLDKREHCLRYSDWTVLENSPLSNELKGLWRKYRQAWRNITKQKGFPLQAIIPVPPPYQAKEKRVDFDLAPTLLTSRGHADHRRNMLKFTPVSYMTNIVSGGVVDRSGFFADDMYTVLSPLQRELSTTKSFADIADERAQYIIDTASTQQREVDLYWSGGIDSTAALAAFLRVAGEEWLTTKLTVVLNNNSINEYPLFYDQFIKDKLRIKIRRNEAIDPMLEFTHDKLVVTGEIGDQIFGNQVMVQDAYPHASPWEDNFIKFKQNSPRPVGTLELSQTFTNYAYAEGFIPRRIVSWHDYTWWLNFTCKWQWVQLRILTQSMTPLDMYSRLFHFFDTLDFERWAVSNMDNKIKDTASTYKYVAKDYIYSITGDAEYRDTKLKYPSLSWYGGRHFGIDANWQPIYAGKRSDDKKALIRKYGSPILKFMPSCCGSLQ